MKKKLLNEVKQFQKIAGILNENSVNLESVFAKHAPNLLKGLKLRSQNPEDVDAHDAVKHTLQSIASELGLDADAPYMEDEMFSGSYSPKEALNYAKEMFAGELEEGVEMFQEAKEEWTSNLNPEVNGIEIYNDGENRLFVIFDKNTGGLHIINDWNGEDFDEVWGTGKDIRPLLMKSISK